MCSKISFWRVLRFDGTSAERVVRWIGRDVNGVADFDNLCRFPQSIDNLADQTPDDSESGENLLVLRENLPGNVPGESRRIEPFAKEGDARILYSPRRLESRDSSNEYGSVDHSSCGTRPQNRARP